MSVLDSIRVYCTIGTGPDIGVLQRCLQGVYNVGVALAVALAFLYIIYGAVEYLVGAATNKQSAGKDKIINALIGMLIIFLSGTVLYWINPQIFSAKLLLYKVKTLEAPRLGLSPEEQSAIIKGDAGWERNKSAVFEKVDKSSGKVLGNVTLRPNDKSSLVTITVFGGKSVMVHKGVAASLQRVSKAWEDKGGQSFYKIESLGGYRDDTIKTPGGKDTGRISWHSYGLAIDINPGENPHTGPSVRKTNMPSAFVELFEKEGWGWGGKWHRSKDPMHFSKAPNERGDGKLEE